jgi:putative ABC transport system permease protein
MILNAMLIALREIRRNLMRSFLTVIGIVIGVAAVVTMVTLGRGATAAVRDQISKIGSNMLIVRPGQDWWGSGTLFTPADLDAIELQIPGIDAVAPMINSSATAVFQEKSRGFSIQGSNADYFRMANWELAMGRFFTEEEVTQAAAVGVIGETVRKGLYGADVNPVGTRLRVGSTSIEVIGVTVAKGVGGRGEDLDDNIIMPHTSVQRRLTGPKEGRGISQVRISALDGYPTSKIVADVAALLRERRNLARNEDNDFNVFDSQELADVISSSTRVMTSLLAAVAGVSLLVGGIGIMNIMLVSVTERTREIGIRMAIGARARDVLLQFLVEAVTLSCIGGLVGILLAWLLCSPLAKAIGAPFLFTPSINVLAFLFSAAIGILFGYMPARRAAKLDPIDALRHE